MLPALNEQYASPVPSPALNLACIVFHGPQR
jgi:hypothetical protein